MLMQHGDFSTARELWESNIPVYTYEVEQLKKLRIATADVIGTDSTWFDLDDGVFTNEKTDILAVANTNTPAAIQSQYILRLLYDSLYL